MESFPEAQRANVRELLLSHYRTIVMKVSSVFDAMTIGFYQVVFIPALVQGPVKGTRYLDF